jgi:adenylosuccinate lyase
MSSQKSQVSNILAERYASRDLCEIWSPSGKVKLERDLWIAVLKTQKSIGIEIPDQTINAYEGVRGQVNLDSIMERERVTRHDVKARIEEFNDLAGHEHIHKGMTSRDLTENVEQLQVYRSLEIIFHKAVASLHRISAKAVEYKSLVLTGRTHNVAAQPTTFGKRLAMFGEELLRGCTVLEQLMQTYPARGIKGAVGTQLDLVTLLGGDSSKIEEFDQRMRDFLGLPGLLGAVGQVYPRSLDFEVVSALFQATSAPSSFARTLRLMAGHELASEGFAKGQVGSSAMPHKMNSRSCERINGFHAILRGHVTMASSLAGDQWNEGDVSCSVVRRAVLPDSFFAADGLLETFLTVLGQMEVFPALIEMENRRYFPFLSTTTILMESVKAGVGRESAHAAIKEHAVATVKNLRSGQITENDLVKRLAEDARLGLSETALQEIVENAAALLGNAEAQVDDFQSRVGSFVARHPNAKNCVPEPLL